jgi:hypothetical protein
MSRGICNLLSHDTDIGCFCVAGNISICDPGPRKGTHCGTIDCLLHGTGRWVVDFLQGSGPERCADPAAVARTSLFITNVRTALCSALRSLSSRRARLSGLRAHRVAKPKKICLYLDHIAEIMNHFTEALGISHLHAVHAGITAAPWVSAWCWSIRSESKR